MDKHISLARELGYEGQELRDYLKRLQDLEREERLAQREYEKEKREAEQKIKKGSKMKKVNKQCLLDTPRTVRVSEKTWQVIVRTRRP